MFNLQDLFRTFEEIYNAESDGDVSLSTYIAHQYQEVQEIQRWINKCGQDEQEVREEYESKIAAIQQERVKVQKKCTHLSVTYYPIASGNSDAHTECDICGGVTLRKDYPK